jgi:hypothetical protein
MNQTAKTQTPASSERQGIDLTAHIDAILEEIDAVLSQQDLLATDGEGSGGA